MAENKKIYDATPATKEEVAWATQPIKPAGKGEAEATINAALARQGVGAPTKYLELEGDIGVAAGPRVTEKIAVDKATGTKSVKAK